MVKTNSYTINSDFPMPAQVSQNSTSVFIPAGSSSGGAGQIGYRVYRDIQLPRDAQILRMNIRCSLTGKTYCGSVAEMFIDGCSYVILISNLGDGLVRCEAFVTSDPLPQTSRDVTFVFNVESFRVP